MRATLGAASLVASGCDPLVSDEEQLEFHNPFRGRGEVLSGFESGDAVVAGSRFCPQITRMLSVDVEQSDFDDCFALSAEGPALIDADDCIQFEDASGLAVLRMSSQTCPFGLAVEPLADDSLRFAVTEPASAQLDYFRLDRAFADGAPVQVDAELPPPSAGPFRLVGASAMALEFSDAAGAGLYWTDDAVELERDGQPLELQGDNVQLDPPAADPFSITARVGASQGGFTLGPFEAATASEAATLELFPIITQSGDSLVPEAVRAVVRDAEGRVLYGAPVEWELTRGELALTPDPLSDPPPPPSAPLIGDLIAAADACEPPPTGRARERSATISAAIGQASASIELVWERAPVEADDEEPFVPSAYCREPTRSCACSSRTGRAPPAWGLAALSLLAWTRRRRGGAR